MIILMTHNLRLLRRVLASEKESPWIGRTRLIGGLVLAGLIPAILILAGSIPTGFQGRTLWDWMDVFGVPVVVVVAGGLFALATQKSNQRAQAEREAEADRAGAEILRGYLDSMSRLVVDVDVDSGLSAAPAGSAARAVASALTFAALRSLSGPRKGILVRYLHDSNLISVGNTVVPLSLADLSDIDLFGADLNLADLSRANLRGADLTEANLRGANLIGSVLYDADLRGADLTGAKVDDQQLIDALSLEGVTMPDGSVMTDEVWERLQREAN